MRQQSGDAIVRCGPVPCGPVRAWPAVRIMGDPVPLDPRWRGAGRQRV